MFALALVVLIVLALPMVAAAGLQVIPSVVAVNKTAGVDRNVTLEIRNTDTKVMYNITFTDNPYISMPRIPSLAAGAAKNITAMVMSDTNASETVRVRGFYQATVGGTHQTHDVEVTAFESDPCDMTIVKGDTVRWTSQVLNDIVLVDSSQGLPVEGGVIANGQSLSKTFAQPGTFHYYFSLSGFQFPQSCVVTILDDSGFVNDPNLDGQLLLDIKLQYTPTTISVTVPIVNYSMRFFETQEGVVTITNTGQHPAKAVHLSGEWLQFNKNDFDLTPGQTAAITYTITPLITRTNQTNMTYSHPLRIAGNFDAVEVPLSIGIAHAVISGGGNGSDPLVSLDALFRQWCEQNQDICKPQVVYRGVNGTSGEFNLTVTQEQWRNFILSGLEEKEIRQTELNALKQSLNASEARDNETAAATVEIRDELRGLREEMVEARESSISSVGLIGGFLIVVCLGVLIWVYRNRNQEASLDRWT